MYDSADHVLNLSMMQQLKVSLGSIFNFILWQHCSCSWLGLGKDCFGLKQKLLEIVLKMTLLQSINAANPPSWRHNTGCFFKESWRNLQQFL